MGPDPSTRLFEAYRRTRYTAGDPAVHATIDAVSPTIDALLTAHGTTEGIFITAWNPGSRDAGAEANRAAAARLAADLASWRSVPHVGIGPDGWREEGLFVLDLPETVGIEIARRYGQVAIVVARRGARARLVLTGVPPAD